MCGRVQRSGTLRCVVDCMADCHPTFDPLSHPAPDPPYASLRVQYQAKLKATKDKNVEGEKVFLSKMDAKDSENPWEKVCMF